MKQTISRTIYTTAIKFAQVEMENGKLVLNEYPVTRTHGKLNEEKAEKYLQSELGYKTAHIIELEHDYKTYEMDLKDFIENSTVVNNKEEK